MPGISRPELRQLITTLFQQKSRSVEFKRVFLQDYFPDVYFKVGGIEHFTDLVSLLIDYEFASNANKILLSLELLFGAEVVAEALSGRGPRETGSDSPSQVPPQALLQAPPTAVAQVMPPPQVGLIAEITQLWVRKRALAMESLREAHALVIGVSQYQHLPVLPNAKNDAIDVAEVLRDPTLCGYPSRQVALLLDPSRAEIDEELAKLSKISPDSTAFLFYAGHGGFIQAGPNQGRYLLPKETKSRFQYGEETYLQAAISEQQLSAALAKVPSRKLFVALDCCYSGGLFRLRDDGSGEAAAQTDTGLTAPMLDALAESLLHTGTGRVIMTAAAQHETSKEIASDRNGLFTKYLLEGLRGAAPGSGPFVEAHELYRYVHGCIQQVPLPSPQTPTYKCDIQTPDFPLAVRPLLRSR